MAYTAKDVQELRLQKQGEEYIAESGSRAYTIIGLTARDLTKLKVTVRVHLKTHPRDFHIDSPDLYQAGSVRRFEDGIVKELGSDPKEIHREIKSLLLALEK